MLRRRRARALMGCVSPPALQLWFEFASTYSYPAVQRIEALAAGLGVAVQWKPFLLGPVCKHQGWNAWPRNLYQPKRGYKLGEQVGAAGAPEARAGPRAETERAIALGIFGAPTAVVGDELFWGNDRLEDALAWTAGRAGDRR